VLVACDQNFPAVLFSEDKKPCISVMRIEDGTMREIGFAVWDLLDGISLPKGSLIMVGSVSDLNSQGVDGYADELARTMRVLREKLANSGNNVQVVALPPVLLGGVNSERLVRHILEAEHWLERLEGGEGALLRGTRGAVMEAMGSHGRGVCEKPKEDRFTVP